MDSLIFTFALVHLFTFSSCIQVTIEKDGLQYNETVISDPLTGDVTTHVPEHERHGVTLLEMTKIENSYLGISVWRESGDQNCYFRHLMDYESPLTMAWVLNGVETRNETLDSSEMTQVTIWATFESYMAEEEKNILTAGMRSLCDEAPIIKMKTEILEKEEFLKKVQEAGDCYMKGRRRRSADSARRSCGTCCKKLRRKRSTGNSNGVDHLVHLIIGHEKF